MYLNALGVKQDYARALSYFAYPRLRAMLMAKLTSP